MGKGVFISVEGIDGSGKTTQLELIEAYLRQKGFDVFVVREPGGSPICEKIRELVLDRDNAAMSPVAEMLLYAASRAQLVDELIRPALSDGKVVLCDRFVDSSLAYQGYGRSLGACMVYSVNEPALGGLLPDITFLFDIEPENAFARRSDTLDRIENEKMEFHMRVLNGYRELAQKCPSRIKIINANVDKIKVFESVRRELDVFLANRGR